MGANSAGAREVIELRVHGVGGSTPEALLGEETQADTIRTAGDDVVGFHGRKRDLHVEGYVWGRLTSGLIVQPLWLLLLPFTLLNVGAWMHGHPRLLRSRWAWTASRVLFRCLAYALTISYVVWLSNIVIKRLFLHWGLGELIAGGEARVLWGIGAMVLLGLVVLVVARFTQRGFEEVEGPNVQNPGTPTSWWRDLVVFVVFPFRPSSYRAVFEVRSLEDDFTSSAFWSRAPEARAQLFGHTWWGMGALVVCSFLSWSSVHAGNENLHLARLVTYLMVVQIALLAALALVHAVGWKRPAQGGFRWLGPAVAAGASVGLATGFFYGLSRFAQSLAPDNTTPIRGSVMLVKGVSRTPATQELELGGAFAVGALVFGFALIATGLWLLWWAHLERILMNDPTSTRWMPANTAPAGAELNGVPGGARLWLALQRSISEALRSIDLVLTASSVAFFVAAIAVIAGWEPPRGLRDFGNGAVWWGTLGALVLLWRRGFKPSGRKVVGILWDVLTFWPRRYHPLAVRPYAERAVPLLQRRLYFHVEGPPDDDGSQRRVLLSAHSQGTIIAYAALRGCEDHVAKEVALVTYGSPLWQLYGRFFPAYFDKEDFVELRSQLYPATRTSPWRNFFRRTDYIGKRVFEGTSVEDCDQEVPDPAILPRISGLDLDQPLDAWPDPVRTAWSALARHSFYNSEVQLKTYVRDVKEELAGPVGPTP